MNTRAGNVLPWERFALGTICHTRDACVFRIGVGWVTVGTAHARPLPARLHDSDTQRSCAGTPGIGPTTLYSPGGPTRSGRLCCQFFEPFGLSSRSCCSTGRLMRSLAPWWGGGRSEASSFFLLGDTTRSGGFSPGRGGARAWELTWRRRLQSAPQTPNPDTKLAMKYPLRVTS